MSQYKYGRKPAAVQPATGVKGVLLRSTGRPVTFRVYHADGNFTDYDLRHDDLRITIDDELASFYDVEGHHILDHSPEVLGLKVHSETSDS